MKRSIIGGVFVVTLLCRAANAQSASDPYANRYWYGALEYGHAALSSSLFGNTSLDGGNVAIGYRWRYFGLEGGDFISSKNGATVNSSYIDLITPIHLSRRFTATLSAGTAYSTDSVSSSVGAISLSSPAWRLGAGLEARITRRIDLRVAYHYLNHTESGWGTANEFSAGLAFRF